MKTRLNTNGELRFDEKSFVKKLFGSSTIWRYKNYQLNSSAKI